MSFARRVVVVVLVAASLLAVDGCSDSDGGRILPTAPTPSVVSSPTNQLLNDPNAISIGLNQATSGAIGISGPWCELWDPMSTYGFPCQTYLVKMPSAGTVHVRVAWSEPNQLLCSAVGRDPNNMTCKNTSPVDASYVLNSGSTFAFAVGYEGGVSTPALPPGFKLNYSVTVTLAGAAVTGRAR